MTEVQFDDAAPQDADPVDVPNGPGGPKPKRKYPSRTGQASKTEKGKGNGRDADGSKDFVEMAASEDAQDQFSQALLGKDYSELTIEERHIIDRLIEDILAGNIDVVVVDEGDGVELPDGVQGGFEAGEVGEPGTIYIANDLTPAERKVVLKEEFGEAIANHAEELGLDLPGGDAGERLLIVSQGGFVDLELTAELFVDRDSDEAVIEVNGEEVLVETRQSTDPENNEALDYIEFFLGDSETGNEPRANDVYVDENGDIIISGIDDDGTSFEITIALGANANGDPTLTLSGTRTNLDGTTEPLFETHTITGLDAVNNAVFDINTLFDEASIAGSRAAYPFIVEADLETGTFSVVQSGDPDVDDALDYILGLPIEDGYEVSQNEDGSIVLTGKYDDNVYVSVEISFSVGADGEPIMTIEGTKRVLGPMDGTIPLMDPVTVTGQDNITAVVGYMNNRFTDAGLTAPGRNKYFEVAPDFVAGGFYTLKNIEFTQTRVVLDDVPENAEAGHVVGEVEIWVDGRWVPVSELPPVFQEAVTVELSNSNGSLDVLPNGQIVVVDPSGLVDGLKVDILVIGKAADPSTPEEFELSVVSPHDSFVPTQSPSGEFVEGRATVGIPEGVEYDEPIILEGEDAELWGTSKAAVVSYVDADGNTVTVILDADPESANYMGVLTTIKDVEGDGLYLYDAQGQEIGYEADTEEGGRQLTEEDYHNTDERKDELVAWAEGQGTVQSSGSNTGMAWTYWTDAEGVHHVTYSYVDPGTGEYVTATAERGSEEARDFAEARKMYDDADQDQGLLGQQGVVQVVGGAALAIIVAAAFPPAAPVAMAGLAAFIAAATAEHGLYYTQERVDALALLSKHQGGHGDVELPWDIDPTPTDYDYTEGDPVPPEPETLTPEEELAHIEIDEAEDANKEAEDAVVAAAEAEERADHAELDAINAENLAAQNPEDAELQQTAETKREEADAARAEADAANEAAALAGEKAAIETAEAVEAANATGDPELIAVAKSQTEMLTSLSTLFLVVAEEDEARDTFIAARKEALENHPDRDFPADVQQNLNDLHAKWRSTKNLTSSSTVAYLDARRDNAALYLDLKTVEADRLVAAAKYAKYEEYEARQEFQQRLAGGADYRESLAFLNAKAEASNDATSKAHAAEAERDHASERKEHADTKFDEALGNASDLVIAAWEFDPQDTTDGATALVPTTDTIIDKDVHTGPAIEEAYGTSAVMVVESMNGDVKTTTIIDVDPASATYGEVLGKVVETPGEGAVLYDGDGNEVMTLTQEELDAAKGITDDGPVGEDHGRNLANDSPDRDTLKKKIPQGGTYVAGSYRQGENLSYLEYTGSDGQRYAVVRHRTPYGPVVNLTRTERYDIILLTDETRALLEGQRAAVNTNLIGTVFSSMGAAAFYFAGTITGVETLLEIYGLEGDEELRETAQVMNYTLGVIGGTAYVTNFFVQRNAVWQPALAGHQNIEEILDSGHGTWVPATADPEGGYTPARISIDGNAAHDVPVADMRLVQREGEQHFTLITPAGRPIPLVNANREALTVIVGSTGRVGFDVNADGVVDFPIPDNATVGTNDDGVAGFIIPSVPAGSANTFIPITDLNALGAELVMVGENLMMQIGDRQFALPGVTPQPSVTSAGNLVLLVIGGQHFAPPDGWIIVNGTDGPQIAMPGATAADPAVPIANLPSTLTPTITFTATGVPTLTITEGDRTFTRELDGATIVIDNNGRVGIDMDGDDVVDVPVGNETPLTFTPDGVGIRYGTGENDFLTVNTLEGADRAIVYEDGAYHIVVNGHRHRIEGDVPANVIVTPATGYTPPDGQVALQMQFGIDGTTYRYNVPETDVNLFDADTTTPIPGAPEGGARINNITLPDGNELSPPSGIYWFLLAGIIIVHNPSASAP
ncbi:MAG: hypothetical protein AAFN63_03800 [Pseudomonadota bacterium]